MAEDLAGKVAVVTGSAQGIGQAIAVRLAEAGATVVVSDIKDGVATVREIEGKGQRALFVATDVSRGEQGEKLISEAVAAFGSVDILVNNAGITRDALVLRMSEADWDQVLNVNLKGAFLCTRAAVKPMIRKRWGRIVNIASVVGLIGNAGQANYSSAKAGIIGLTKSVAREVASRGVTVNAIAPGFIDTEMTRKLPEAVRQEVLRQIPLGVLGTPRDVANAVAFLCSNDAAYITGHVLRVDGGLAMV